MGRKKVLPQLLTRSSPSTGRTLAYARFDRQVISFGPAGPEAERRFHMALAEWLASGRVLPEVEPEVLTVHSPLRREGLLHDLRLREGAHALQRP